MEKTRLDVPPVGVKMLRSLDGLEAVEAYRGVSYCDAVRRATLGEELLVKPGSIEVCRWSPVVLGLKEPEGDFESGLEPRLEHPVAGVYLAPVDRFGDGVETAGGGSGSFTPDVVIVRGSPAALRRLASEMGDGVLQERYRGRIGVSALGVGARGLSWRVMLVHALNYPLSVLVRMKFVDRFIKRHFQRESVSRAFERAAKNKVADMSICRNSTAVPHLEDSGNISFFCTGGVTWGGNSPRNMTCGFPYRLFDEGKRLQSPRRRG